MVRSVQINSVVSIVVALVSVGCAEEERLLDGPMPIDELVDYQGCTDVSECVAVRNGPDTGCSCIGPASPDLVAINSTRRGEFYDRFEQPTMMCDVECPTYEQRFWDSGYVLDCVSGLCEVVERRDHSGQQCGGTLGDCPEGYTCETNSTGYPEMACLFNE